MKKNSANRAGIHSRPQSSSLLRMTDVSHVIKDKSFGLENGPIAKKLQILAYAHALN